MAILRGFWRFLVGVKDALVLFFLLLFFAALWAGVRSQRTQAIPQNGALVLDLTGTLVEQARETEPFELVSGASLPQEVQLRDAVRAVRSAATDGRVKALVLNLDGFLGGGQANVAALGREVDAFRKRGKPVYAYATGYLDEGYLLASHASEVWLNPLGGVLLTGPGGTSPYFGQALDRLGVTINVFRVGTYKSFVEPFTRNDQSPEAKAADQALVNTLWQVYTGDVARARPNANVTAYLSNLPARLQASGGDLATTAKSAGLVDQLGDMNALGRRLRERGVKESEGNGAPGGFAQIDHRAYLSATPQRGTGDAVGVVYVAGDIVDGEAQPGTAGGDTIAGLVEDALADDQIKALVIRIDSPGGSVTASETIRQAILSAKAKGLPVVTSMGPVAASGGYWVATAGETIYAEPSTVTGSIGVFAVLPSFERTLERLRIGADGVKSTPYSGEPDLLRGIGPETKLVLQAGVEDVYRRFLKVVADARRSDPAAVDRVAQGRVWAGTTALDLKLVDRMGGLDAALAEARRRAKLADTARVIAIEPKPLLPRELLQQVFRSGGAGEDARLPAAKAAARAALRMETAGAQALSVAARPNVMALCVECVGERWTVPAAPRDGWQAALARVF